MFPSGIRSIIQVHFKVKTFSAFFLYFSHYFSMFCIFRASRCLTALSVGTFSVVFHGFVVHFWILGNAVIFCSSLTIFRKDFIIMQFYLAPMEGLTGYVYRNAYHKYFPAADRYFTPFITNKKMSSRERNDILPEHNQRFLYDRTRDAPIQHFFSLQSGDTSP